MPVVELPVVVPVGPVVAVVLVVEGDVVTAEVTVPVVVEGDVVALPVVVLVPSSSSSLPKQPVLRSPKPMAVIDTSAFFILNLSSFSDEGPKQGSRTRSYH